MKVHVTIHCACSTEHSNMRHNAIKAIRKESQRSLGFSTTLLEFSTYTLLYSMRMGESDIRYV